MYGGVFMRLNIVKSKNAEQLYIIKSFRKEDGKTSSRIVKKLGTMASLLPKHDNNREKVIAWGKEQAELLTAQEATETLSIEISLSENKQNKKGEKKLFQCGYLFPQYIYHKLGLHEICKEISNKHNINYDLSDILAKLIYTRILSPNSKLSSFESSKDFVQPPNFELHQIYRALSLLSGYSDEIQAKLYKNSLDVLDRNKGILYYDCTNYFFEIEKEKGSRKYGKCKEHRPNPIVQMGLFMDGNGLPLAFSIFPGNESEQPSLKPLEKKIIQDFGLSKFVVCTDAGLASTDNRIYNNIQNRSFIVTQSLKSIKSHIKEWALSPIGWKIDGSENEYNLNEINENDYMDTIFHKERWINENGLEQRLIVSFSPKYKYYQRDIRLSQIERAEKNILKGKSSQTRNTNSPNRFIEETAITEDGEIANKKFCTLDDEKIKNEEMFDGFYAVCTTLEDKISDILHINKQRWQIEAAFRTMKTEFKARPVYLQRDERIESHFLTCFIALLILKIIENKLNNKYSTEDIIHTLRKMSLYKLRGLGYMSSYERTDLTDDLHKVFGFQTDNEFISVKTMKNIFKITTKS